MRNKPALLFALKDNFKAVFIYYLVILSLNIVALTISRVSGSKGNINGIDLSSAIFMLVLGLVTLKQTFHFLIQHGCSRRRFYEATSLAIIILAAALAVLDVAIVSVFNFTDNYFSIESNSINLSFASNSSPGGMFIQGLITNILFGLTGLFLAAIYYRMSVVQKILVSAGIPLTLLVVLPVVDHFLNTDIFVGLLRLAILVFYGMSSYDLIDTNLLIAAVRAFFVVLGFLLYLLGTVRMRVKT